MMPADGIAANRLLMPYGMNPPCEPKLLPRNWVSSAMMAITGIATFHHVTALLTRANRRMARKLTTVKSAIRRMEIRMPYPVVTPVSALNTPCQ